MSTAILLAAGKGKRLDRHDTPKALVRVGHKPLILWNIEQLQEAGIEDIIVVVGHEADEIRKELTAHPALRRPLKFVEVNPLEAGLLGSVQHGMRFARSQGATGPLFVVMSDLVLQDSPYARLEAALKSYPFAMTVGADPEFASVSGAQCRVRLDGGVVRDLGRHLDPALNPARDVGVYAFGPEAATELINWVPRTEERFEDVLRTFIQRPSGSSSVTLSGPWFDVNTPETCMRAELSARKRAFQEPARSFSGAGFTHMEPAYSFKKRKETTTHILFERGLLDRLDKIVIIPEEHARSRHILITDRTVHALIGERILSQLTKAGYDVRLIIMDPGERAKTMENYMHLAERVLGEGIDERSIILTLGGGAVGNVAGFLAATLYRGIGLIHIPTTVMGQSDAAIGVKQGINGEKGKNLIGAFYEPISIIVDPSILSSLPDRLIRDGLSECIKHALVQDAEFFQFFRNYQGSIRDLDFLERVVRKNIELKIALMEQDYREDKDAMVLQYGHEVGHAVEYLSGFEYYHGESIAIGMRVAAELALIMGMCSKEIVDAHLAVFRQYGFQTEIPASITPDAIMDTLRFTKKARHGDLRFALPATIGSLWHADGEYALPCPLEHVRRAVERSYLP